MVSEVSRTRTIASAIAALVALLRPDWGQAGMVTLIEREAASSDPATVVLALLLGARDPQTRTPRRCLVTNGPVWQQACQLLRPAVAGHPDRPPKRDEECRTHPGQWAGSCPACATDRAIDAAVGEQQARCLHEEARAVTYARRGPRQAAVQVEAWHCPDCDLITDTDPR